MLQGASVRRSAEDSVFRSDHDYPVIIQRMYSTRLTGECRIDNESLQDCAPFGDRP